MQDQSTEPQLELPIHPTNEASPFTRYFRLLFGLMTKPRETFDRIVLPISLPGAVFFALVTHWMGAALEWVWKSALGKALEERPTFWMKAVERIFNEASDERFYVLIDLKEKFLKWVWGIGSVFIDPVITASKLLILGSLVWIGAKILHGVPPTDEKYRERLSFSTAVCLICLSQAPSILQGLPLFGNLVSQFFCFFVLVIGVSRIYRVNIGRAVVIAAFPTILFWLSVLGAIAFVAFFVFRIVTSFL